MATGLNELDLVINICTYMCMYKCSGTHVYVHVHVHTFPLK